MCSRPASRFDFAQGPEPVEGHRVRYFGWLHPAAKRERAVRGRPDLGGGATRKPCYTQRLNQLRMSWRARLPPSRAIAARREPRPPGACDAQGFATRCIAVVMIVRPKAEAPPPWHLRCPHCERFTLVAVASLARAPP